MKVTACEHRVQAWPQVASKTSSSACAARLVVLLAVLPALQAAAEAAARRSARMCGGREASRDAWRRNGTSWERCAKLHVARGSVAAWVKVEKAAASDSGGASANALQKSTNVGSISGRSLRLWARAQRNHAACKRSAQVSGGLHVARDTGDASRVWHGWLVSK